MVISLNFLQRSFNSFFITFDFIDTNCKRWYAISIMTLPLKVLFKNILEYIKLSIKVILESVI